jgi:5-methylcytosine-specific restriction endonuclease McrA
VSLVGRDAFNDVLPSFSRLGRRANFDGMFYRYEHGVSLTLTDSVFEVYQEHPEELSTELDSRWGLLEGAFKIGNEAYHLNNDLRMIYIEKGYDRKNVTNNIPFLQGYQGNTCFYCGEPIDATDIAVDHVLPRQVVMHDEIWNLVLAHNMCNGQKTDRLVGPHFIQKLIARNENIMGSNHPWKKRIEATIGATRTARISAVKEHYSRVAQIIGHNYWGGTPGYSPETDPFFRRLITVLNNGKL